MKVYEIHEELLIPFLKRAVEKPAELEALLPRMDEMDGGGKLRVLGNLKFRKATEIDRFGVVANHPTKPSESDLIKYRVSGRWYNGVGSRTVTAEREVKKGVYLPAYDITLGHILGKQWSLSLVVATAEGYLVVVERWIESSQDSPSTGWVAAPSPSMELKLSADRMPSVLKDFQNWGSGAFIVCLPRHHVDWASAVIKIKPQYQEEKQPGQNLNLEVEIRYHKDKESLVTLQYSGQFVHKRTTKGYIYDNYSGAPAVKLVNPLNIGKVEQQISRQHHIELRDGYQTETEPTKQKALIQMAVFQHELP